MKILVLGGTRFVGRHLVAECLDRGDDVTVLHRGQSPSPFSGRARHVITDRLQPTPQAVVVLREPWDAVIDTSARGPDDLRPVLPALGEVGRYVLLSSCGVYRRVVAQPPMLTESSATIPTGILSAARVSAIGKLRCEQYLQQGLDGAGVPWLIARLGLVVGTFDTSQRLTYWLERALRGGDMLVPMDPHQPLQLIDADDVARFLLTALDKALTGIVNVAGPADTAQHLIDTLTERAGRPITPHWVGENFAVAQGLRPWVEIPLWLPATSPERILMTVSSTRAQAAGLSYRPLGDTISECLTWQAVQRDNSWQWLNPARERHLLARWRR